MAGDPSARSRQRSRSAVIPSTQRSASSRAAAARKVSDSSRQRPMTGSMTLSSKLPLAPGQRDRRVVADHLGAHHERGLRDDRVDLARHDAGARLQVGQVDLAEPGARSRAHPPQVVADLGQADRDHLGGAAERHQRVLAGLAPRSGCPPRAAGCRSARRARAITAAANPGAAFRPVPAAVPPSGSSAAPSAACRMPGPTELDLAGVAAELLAEGHRHGVHQVGAAGLDHGGELGLLARQRRRRGGPGPARAPARPR